MITTGSFMDAQDRPIQDIGELIRRFPDIEPIFRNHAEMMLKHGTHNFNSLLQYYARIGIEMDAETLEKVKNNPISAASYANYMKKRWPEAEATIMKDPKAAASYAAGAMGKKRWPEAEPVIFTDRSATDTYIRAVGRIPDLEGKFLQLFKSGTDVSGGIKTYILNAAGISKARMPAIEKIITSSKNASLASLYAINILEDRWPAMEDAIVDGSEKELEEYVKKVGRVPAVEDKLVDAAAESTDDESAKKISEKLINYVEITGSKRNGTIEKAIMAMPIEHFRVITAGEYALKIKDRFPEMESEIGAHKFWGFMYDKALKTSIRKSG